MWGTIGWLSIFQGCNNVGRKPYCILLFKNIAIFGIIEGVHTICTAHPNVMNPPRRSGDVSLLRLNMLAIYMIGPSNLMAIQQQSLCIPVLLCPIHLHQSNYFKPLKHFCLKWACGLLLDIHYFSSTICHAKVATMQEN